MQTHDSSLFIGPSYFLKDGAQLYLIFQILPYTLKLLGSIKKIVWWKSKGFSPEKITTTDNSLSPSIKWYRNSNFCLVIKRNCLNQKNATYISPNRIIFLIVYELDTWSQDLNSGFTLKECLFRGAQLAKNANPDKYVYSVMVLDSICVQNFHYLMVT